MTRPITTRTKHGLAVLGAVVTSIALALLGAYILRNFRTGMGLGAGLVCELLAIAIALPTPFHAGVVVLKENLVLIVPVITDALKGGARRSDPPADPPRDPSAKGPAKGTDGS